MIVPPLTAEEAEIVNGLDPALRPVALRHREETLTAGDPFRFLSGLRSRSQQGALKADPTRTTPAAPAGTSKHEVGGAYDLERQSARVEARVGAIGERLGLRWGGRFQPKPDPNHFEVPVTRATFSAYRNVTLLSVAAVAGLGLAVGMTQQGKG